MAMVLITHDLGVAQGRCDEIGVMYAGRIVETAPAPTVFDETRHPYTEALLSAVPLPNPKARRDRIILTGDIPSPINPPTGCRFHTRCPYVEDRCRVDVPVMKSVAPEHMVACHLR